MNEHLKKQIDRLIEQINAPLPANPVNLEYRVNTVVAQTTRILAGEHLMGLMVVGLNLGGMTNEEMLEVIQRANTIPDAVASDPKG